MTDSAELTESRWSRLRRGLQSSELKLYVSFFLSSWGDRMWAFALSIALGTIGNKNMQLTAINGFVESFAVLLLGASVGRWIDKTPRLKAASTILIINNLSVFLSAFLLFIVLYAPERIAHIWNGGLQTLLIAFSVTLCAINVLASMATKICLTKDWIIVITGPDKDKLANVNAWMLRLNLTSLVLAPLTAGQIMSSFSPAIGCLFIAIWNFVSFGIEYLFLRLVYKSCPLLAVKHSSGANESDEQSALSNDNREETDPNDIPDEVVNVNEMTSSFGAHCSRLFLHFKSAVYGWKTYCNQSVFPAGLGLALLYLTVLGFDGITTVYVYSQGIQENVVALCQGIGAIFGITGSFVYPIMRKRIGLERTGLFALAVQIMCNTFSLISIWLPGSPFDPKLYFDDIPSGDDDSGYSTTVLYYRNDSGGDNVTSLPETTFYQSKCSISSFLLGIVSARFGLWIADLAISQIMQENIVENERGVVNGVQSSINMTMNMVKELLVIIFPDPSTFGLLIVVSYCSVSSGFFSYSMYSKKIRGHLLPFHKQLEKCYPKATNQDNHADDQQVTTKDDNHLSDIERF